jgi:hypothetical protein
MDFSGIFLSHPTDPAMIIFYFNAAFLKLPACYKLDFCSIHYFKRWSIVLSIFKNPLLAHPRIALRKLASHIRPTL